VFCSAGPVTLTGGLLNPKPVIEDGIEPILRGLQTQAEMVNNNLTSSNQASSLLLIILLLDIVLNRILDL
jgi:hypothetical protein